MKDCIQEVACHHIRVSPFQPRKIIADEELDELALSIKTVGLIHPPVVRKIEHGGALLYYELIAGERRWRAMQRAGFDKLHVIVRDSSDAEAAKASLIENVQRVDLNPIECAEAFQRLLTIFNMTQAELAQRVGKKRSTIANYLRLLTLPQAIRDSVTAGVISMGHAKAILSLESDELKEALHELIMKNQLTVREAEKESGQMAKSPQAPSKEIYVVELEERLRTHFGTKVSIHHSAKKGGKVTLHY